MNRRIFSLPARPPLPILLLLLATMACTARAQNAESLVLIGDARYAAFDTDGAISAFEDALSLEPSDPEILIRLARSWNDLAADLHAASDEDGARAASRTAVAYAERLTADFADDARSWFYLAASTGTLALFSDGRERLQLGRRIEEFCHRSIRLDSTYALPHVALGMYYREVADLGRVRRFLADRLLGGLPERPRRRALVHMAVAERLSPGLPVVVFQRARTLEHFGHHDEAMEAYRRFLRMRPLNSRDYRNFRETLTRLDQIDPDDTQRSNSADPGRASVWR